MNTPSCAGSRGVQLAVLLCGIVFSAVARERISLNADWRFNAGDSPDAAEQLGYRNLKAWILPSGNGFRTTNQYSPPAGAAPVVAFAQKEFSDAGWRTLNLPHDWGIEGPFKQEYPGETGKLPWWGVAWYRKHFNLPASDAGQRFVLEVDGAMAYASVWLNGHFVGGWPYGYASWQLDLTPFVNVGGENVLAVRLDNPKDSSRWYPGGGIYRNVWLTKMAPVHFDQWGVKLATPDISAKAATVHAQLLVVNNAAAAVEVNARVMLFDLTKSGERAKRAVATIETSVQSLAAGETSHLDSAVALPKPALWSVTHPNRYLAVTQLLVDGKIVDEVETPFGIRTIQFTADNGFLLNGERVPIKGVCNHHDLGALGTAFNVRAAERQLEILKEMGCNAIRTSHNPPAPELLDLCDRLGFLVMDEAFDCWQGRKKPDDYHLLFSDWSEADLRALVRRDRNHPCVILWSTGNEMPDQRNAAGVALSRQLTAIVKSEDDTRFVSAGCNHDIAGFNGFQNTVDVFGFNYKPHLYARFRATNAALPLISSESASCVSSRGEYVFPVSNDKAQGRMDWQVSSYDLYAPGWAMPPDSEFRGQDTNRFVAGEFVWTGFDYLGEPTPYNDDLTVMLNYSDPAERARVEQELKELGKIKVPSRSSYFGIVDLAGFKKDRFFLYQARWRPDFPMVHILPHWTWPGREGQVTPVHVYTSGDEAELFLNGKSQGRRTKPPLEYRLRWDEVKYAPGELKVVAYKHGKKWATEVVKTAGPAAKLALAADRSVIAADGKDLAFITVTVADRKGELVPRARDQLTFTIEGPGEIVATDNGDPTSFESFQTPERKAFNGLALVIVRGKAGVAGKIRLVAWADNLTSSSLVIRSN